MQLARFLAVVTLSVALPATALLTRPDRDDAEYLELATKYKSALLLTPAGAEGVLISARWVLTSADAARTLRDARKVRVGTVEHDIQAIYPHPVNDVALVYLKKASSISPTPLYRGDDEKGKTVVFVGHGADRRMRAAINTVDQVTPTTLGLEIKPLGDASDLQGALTVLELGAPAYIESKEGLFVAGVGHRATDGASYFMRASAFAAWVEAQMTQVAIQEADALLDSDRR